MKIGRKRRIAVACAVASLAVAAVGVGTAVGGLKKPTTVTAYNASGGAFGDHTVGGKVSSPLKRCKNFRKVVLYEREHTDGSLFGPVATGRTVKGGGYFINETLSGSPDHVDSTWVVVAPRKRIRKNGQLIAICKRGQSPPAAIPDP